MTLRLLTTGGAARLAGVDRSTILKRVTRGVLIPTARTESNQLLFTRSEIETYAAPRRLRRQRRAEA